ncbi:hypothetical protein C8R44DRAFT_729731 [Mycena epipterygia]|nr:hypothetical protein C8R44DRAFT_729731 [Mycena epipterygia]
MSAPLVPAVPSQVVPLHEDIDILCALARGTNEPTSTPTLLRHGRGSLTTTPRNAWRSTYDPNRHGKLLDSLAYLSVFEARKQVVAIGMELGHAGGPVVLKVAENGPVAKKTVEHLEYIFKMVAEIRRLIANDRPAVQDGVSSTRYDVLAVIHSNELAKAEYEAFETRVISHSWLKLKRRLEKRIGCWHNIVKRVREVKESPLSDASPLSSLSSDDIRVLGEMVDQISILEIAIPGEEDWDDMIRLALFALHTRCRLLVEAWENDPGDSTTLFARCTSFINVNGFNMAQWISKLISLPTHILRICHVIGSRRFSPFIAVTPKVEPIPGILKTVTVDVSLADVECVAKAAGWEPKEQSASDAANGDGSSGETAGENQSIKDMALKAFHGELEKHLEPGGTTSNSDHVQRTYEDYVHCEAALLAHLHGRTSSIYIGLSKPSCALCAMYFAAYREATGIQMTTTHGPRSRLGLWFVPTLETNDDAVRRCLKSRLLEPILRRLQRLEREADSRRALSQGTLEDTVMLNRINARKAELREVIKDKMQSLGFETLE